MIKNILLLALIFASSIVHAQDEKDEKNVNSTIKAVTVFLSGAQVERTANAPYTAGENTLVFTELSQYVQSKSVQLDGKGDFTILSIEHRAAKNEPQAAVTPEIANLENQITKIAGEITFHNKLANIYAEEKNFILTNKAIAGSETGVSFNELKQIADFYRARFSELEKLEIERQNNLVKLHKDQTELSKKLTELKPKAKKTFTEVAVKILAKQAGTAQFELSYFVNQAQWSPAYDVRMNELNKPLQFTLRANVYQNTQENWDNVKLTLSTSNPTQNSTKPELYPQYANFWENYARPTMYQENAYSETLDETLDMEQEVAVAGKRATKNLEAAKAAPPTVNAVTRAVATDYEINERYTIKGEQGKQVVVVQQVEVPATYEHRAIPKLDKAVYLTASISNWESYGFMQGPMNLYLEGKYTGESYLNSEATEDTLLLSLGRDKSVVVEREQIKDFKSKKFLGSKTTDSYGYLIKVRNNKKTAIHLIVEDQIPISQNEAIEVELLEKSKAKHDETNGFLTWDLDLKGGEKKEFDFKYEIRYPNKKRIIIQ